MITEIYRSFDVLSQEVPTGYIVYKDGEWRIIEWINVCTDKVSRCRMRQEDATYDPSDLIDVMSFVDAVESGEVDGWIMYNGDWRRPSELIEKYGDPDWRKYCE